MMVNELLEYLDEMSGEVVFGPAVTDFKSGKPSKNIDIFMSSDDAKHTFSKYLQDDGYSVTKIKTMGAQSYRRTIYTVTNSKGETAVLSVHLPKGNKTLNDVIIARYDDKSSRRYLTYSGRVYNVDQPLVEKTVKKETDMTKEFSFMDMVKDDGVNAAYRMAATQMTNGTKGAILALMEKKGADSERLKAIADLLDSEFGAALISLLLGYGLTYAPKISEDNRVKRLAGEFRVNGMATAGNAVFDVAKDTFLPVVMSALASLPEVEAEKEPAKLGSENEEAE